jgi:hypothetical protein
MMGVRALISLVLLSPVLVGQSATTICEAAKDPTRFNGQMVNLRGKILPDFEEFEITAQDCDVRIWLEYASGPKQQPTLWCCGAISLTDKLSLVQNKDFKRFHSYITSRRAGLPWKRLPDL